MKRSPFKRTRRANLKPRKPIPAKNGKRRAKAFARAYGSIERVQWVKDQLCIVDSPLTCLGEIENAHIVGGGIGRKSDAANVVPLCVNHHRVLHEIGPRAFERRYVLSLAEHAELTDAAWQEVAA